MKRIIFHKTVYNDFNIYTSITLGLLRDPRTQLKCYRSGNDIYVIVKKTLNKK